MQDCAAVFDRLPRLCTTPAQLPHIPLSHITVLADSVLAVLVHRARLPGQVEDLPTVKGDFYGLGHIPNIIGAIDGTHVALVPPRRSEQVYRNRKRSSWRCCMLHNLALRRQVPFLQEDGPEGGLVAAVEPVDSEEEEAEEEDIDNRNVIQQYFQ
ncbi:hypothetical protein NDU88_000168 [Pleurodeles waltl]|uniref:Nuclease HARBI1 n=1 Tax=Pleurodeles waltl TaxID=8319 RepID=A0AAV7R6H5_PLEWA|nr:hypothetical protein NDU88_000168 [Pleurodeles waltl]